MAMSPCRDSSRRTTSGATKNAVKMAASGRTSLESASIARALLELDLAVEAIDQRATLRIDLLPIEGADLGDVVERLRQRLGDGAFELDLGVGRNDVVGGLQQFLLGRCGQM